MSPPGDCSSVEHIYKQQSCTYLVDLILCGLQGLDDGLQLDLASSQTLLQLFLLLL